MEDINADSISDLCAEDNCISTWYVGNRTKEEIEYAVAAIASGFKNLDGFSMVFISEEDLTKAGLEIKPSQGKTAIKEFENLHRDIRSLNAAKLNRLAEVILKNIWTDNKELVNAEEISMILFRMITENKLGLDDLDKNLRSGFAGRIKKLINKNHINWDNLPDDIKNSFINQWDINKRKTNCIYESECYRYQK